MCKAKLIKRFMMVFTPSEIERITFEMKDVVLVGEIVAAVFIIGLIFSIIMLISIISGIVKYFRVRNPLDEATEIQ